MRSVRTLTRRRQLYVAAALLFALIECVFAAEKTLPDVDLVGNDRVLWISVYRSTAGQGRRLSFAFRASDPDMFVGPQALRNLESPINCLGLINDDLHVFYDQGTHRRYRFQNNSFSRATERPLPDKQLPQCVAGSANHNALYAIVSSDVGVKVWREEKTREWEQDVALRNEDHNENEGEDDELQELLSHEPNPGESHFAVVRYIFRVWEFVGFVPAWLNRAKPTHLAADSESSLHLGFVDSNGALRYARFAENRWTSPVSISEDPDARLLALLCDQDPFSAVVFVDNVPLIYAYQDESWSKTGRLTIEQSTLQSEAVAASSYESKIAFAIIDEQNRVFSGFWPAAGGVPLEPLEEVTSLSDRSEQLFNLQAQSLLAFAVLGIMLIYVFVKRSDSIARDLELPAHYVVAGYWRRMAGFIIDATPASLLTLPFWRPALSKWFNEYSLRELEGGNAPPLSHEVLVGWLIACGAYTVYCLACEAYFASTPGKIAFNCRVVNERGRRCRFNQVAVRNVIRLVELFPLFQLWPTMILMLFSRNRQRLGDLMGRTVVVERVDLQSITPPHQSTQQ